MSNETRKVSVISIQSDENYYNTQFQVEKRKIKYFTDNFGPSKLSGSNDNSATGFFQVKSTFNNDIVENSSTYPTSSTVTDSSGNARKILSPDVDYFSSSSLDSYKNGVEITKNSHWSAGLVKISAGTPGHLYEKSLYGVNDLDIISADKYIEIDVFNPINYLNKNIASHKPVYPVVTSDVNQLENSILNGIIEPFPIRPVIANFSVNFPFEPQSFKGQFGNGNINWRSATDSVVSIEINRPGRSIDTHFLDASDVKKITTDDGSITASLGPADGYINANENYTIAFDDIAYPRNEIPSASYGSDLLDAIKRMSTPDRSENYVKRNQKSSTNGLVCEYSNQGTDSVTFRNLVWNKGNRDNRRHRQSILNLRDSESFVDTVTTFNDTSIIFFSASLNTMEYPTMLPLEITGSIGLSATVRSELFKENSIRVLRWNDNRSGLYETPLQDSILSANRRLGL